MKIKLKWKVDPIPTGQWSSFQKRAWPSAEHLPKEIKEMAGV